MAVNCEKVVGDLFAAWTRLNLDEVMSHFAEAARISSPAKVIPLLS
jgi:hypothetical protein